MKNQFKPMTMRSTFLEAMSRVASTVNIVTTDGPAGRAGATVSSLVSVSADSPMPTVLVCLQRESRTALATLENGVFCVNSLGSDQATVAGIFASKSTPNTVQRFDPSDWQTGATGAPRMLNALVALECRVAQTAHVGLHHVIFGEVENIVIGQDASPLVYVNRGYASTVAADLSDHRTAA